MLRDHACGFLVWVQCGPCLLFSCLSACTLDRAGLQAALERTDSSAAEMLDASVGVPHDDACHDASVVRSDASHWPVRDAQEPENETEEPTLDAGPAFDAGRPRSDAGQPTPEAGADASLPDLCPNDAVKTVDIDSDGDDVLDCNDECPSDAQKVSKGMCGCGIPEPGDGKRPKGRRGETCPER